MPLTWPLGHIGTAVSKPEEDQDVPKPSATPYLTLVRQPAWHFLWRQIICKKKKGRPPHFYGRSNTILGTCLPLHLPSAATIWTGWKSNSTITSYCWPGFRSTLRLAQGKTSAWTGCFWSLGETWLQLGSSVDSGTGFCTSPRCRWIVLQSTFVCAWP